MNTIYNIKPNINIKTLLRIILIKKKLTLSLVVGIMLTVGGVYLSQTNRANQVKAESVITKIGQIGGFGSQMLITPNGIALDSFGNVYVVNEVSSRIQKFDSSGNYLAQWGTEGSGNGEFDYPRGIAIDSSGNVYVADTQNHRIQKFDSSGNYLTQWGTEGSGDGEFDYPSGIAIDSSGNIYVTDRDNHRIQKFDSSGNYLAQWGTEGSGDGEFRYPSGITIDANNDILVVDSSRIQKFDSSGNYLAQWGASGSGNGELSWPKGIAIDSSGNVYVADTQNHRIQKFDSSGNYLAQWGTEGSGNGEFDYPSGIAIDSLGNIYVTDRDNHRIQKFDSSGSYISSINTQNRPIASFKISSDESGNIFAPIVPIFVNPAEASTLVYSPEGQLLSEITLPAEENSSAVVAAVSNDYIFVLGLSLDDGSSPRIIKLSKTDNSVITSWPVDSPSIALVTDTQGNVYYYDPMNSVIKKYDSNGNHLQDIGSPGMGDGQLSDLFSEEDRNAGLLYASMAVDTSGNIYVTDVVGEDEVSIHSRIQKFDQNGNFIKKWDANVNELVHVYKGPNSSLYVTSINMENHSVAIKSFDNNLQELSAELTGAEIGEGLIPSLAVGNNGRIYLTNVSDFSIDIYCDNSVSSNGCQATGNDGDDDNGEGGNNDNDGEGNNPGNNTNPGGDNNSPGNNSATTDPSKITVTSPGSKISIITSTPTINKRPTFSGVTTPLSTVTVTVHSDPVTCTTTSDSQGHWSCTLPSDLPPGQHTVNILITKPDNTTEVLGPYTVTVEPDIPTTITSKDNNSNKLANTGTYLAIGSMLAVGITVTTFLLTRSSNRARKYSL